MEPRSLSEAGFATSFAACCSRARQPPKRAFALVSLAIVLALPAVILYPTLGFHLLEPDEGRYAQIPKEMLVHHSWVVPTLQGEPYLDKPPLLYWLVALSYRAFGVTPEAARLVPAICVHLTILAVYLIGRRSIGERAAFWAALFLSVAPGFVSRGAAAPTRWSADALRDALGALRLRGGANRTIEARLVVRVRARFRSRVSDQGADLRSAAVRAVVGVCVFERLVRPRPLVLVPALSRHRDRGECAVVCRDLPGAAASSSGTSSGNTTSCGSCNRSTTCSRSGTTCRSSWQACCRGRFCSAAYFWRIVRSDGIRTNSLAGGFWLLAGLWCVFFFSCSGSKLPTYILPAYPFLCLALGEFVARSRWNTAISTRVMVGAMAAIVLFVHHSRCRWYAKERSPFGRPELVEKYVDDPNTTVVCFPRNCDSLAFYSDRDDLRNVRTKDVNQMFVDCHHRSRTVILFTHSDSLSRVAANPPAKPGDRRDDDTQAEGGDRRARQALRRNAVGPVRRGGGRAALSGAAGVGISTKLEIRNPKERQSPARMAFHFVFRFSSLLRLARRLVDRSQVDARDLEDGDDDHERDEAVDAPTRHLRRALEAAFGFFTIAVGEPLHHFGQVAGFLTDHDRFAKLFREGAPDARSASVSSRPFFTMAMARSSRDANAELLVARKQ